MFPVRQSSFGSPCIKILVSKKYILSCLSVPISNANVERIFSLVLVVKTKARNSIQLQLLDSIVKIRSDLLFSGKCCKHFWSHPGNAKQLHPRPSIRNTSRYSIYRRRRTRTTPLRSVEVALSRYELVKYDLAVWHNPGIFSGTAWHKPIWNRGSPWLCFQGTSCEPSWKFHLLSQLFCSQNIHLCSYFSLSIHPQLFVFFIFTSFWLFNFQRVWVRYWA